MPEVMVRPRKSAAETWAEVAEEQRKVARGFEGASKKWDLVILLLAGAFLYDVVRGRRR
jgi:hypothetical protein